MLCFCCLFCSTKTKDLPNDLKKIASRTQKIFRTCSVLFLGVYHLARKQ